MRTTAWEGDGGDETETECKFLGGTFSSLNLSYKIRVTYASGDQQTKRSLNDLHGIT